MSSKIFCVLYYFSLISWVLPENNPEELAEAEPAAIRSLRASVPLLNSSDCLKRPFDCYLSELYWISSDI